VLSLSRFLFVFFFQFRHGRGKYHDAEDQIYEGDFVNVSLNHLFFEIFYLNFHFRDILKGKAHINLKMAAHTWVVLNQENSMVLVLWKRHLVKNIQVFINLIFFEFINQFLLKAIGLMEKEKEVGLQFQHKEINTKETLLRIRFGFVFIFEFQF
jgi:hypothetical protein